MNQEYDSKKRTGRTPKDDRMIINAMFRLARSEKLPGQPLPNDTIFTILFIAVFVNVEIMEHFCTFFQSPNANGSL